MNITVYLMLEDSAYVDIVALALALILIDPEQTLTVVKRCILQK